MSVYCRWHIITLAAAMRNQLEGAASSLPNYINGNHQHSLLLQLPETQLIKRTLPSAPRTTTLQLPNFHQVRSMQTRAIPGDHWAWPGQMEPKRRPRPSGVPGGGEDYWGGGSPGSGVDSMMWEHGCVKR